MDIPRHEKHERLRDVGVITADGLHEEYASVVDSLTPDELELLIAVKQRLDLAQEASGAPIDDNFMAP